MQLAASIFDSRKEMLSSTMWKGVKGGKEPGEGVVYAVKGVGGVELKGKAWESILLCYHVSRGPLYCGQDTKALASNWWLAKVWRKHELQFICSCYPFKHATQHRCYRCYRHVLPMPLIHPLCSSYSIIWWKFLALKVNSHPSPHHPTNPHIKELLYCPNAIALIPYQPIHSHT